MMKNITTYGNKLVLLVAAFSLLFSLTINTAAAEKINEKKEVNCGILCLQYAANLCGVPTSLSEMESVFKGDTSKSVSLYDLFQAAQELGLSAMAVRATWEELLESKLPAIAWVKKNHFVVVERSVGDKILVVDLPEFARLYAREEFEKIWSGELLIVSCPRVKHTQIGNPPKIVFDKLIYNFGTVDSGVITSCTFSFSNAGGMPLNIAKIESGCGCIATLLGNKELKPAESSEIVVKFYTAGRKGKQTHKILVYSNDLENPKITLSINALVKGEIEVKPLRLYFGEIGIGESRTKEIFIIGSGADDLEVKKVEASSSDLELDVKPYRKVKDEFKRWVIKATLLPKKALGEFKEKIVITTNSPNKPVVEVPVEAKVVGDLAFLPAKAFFGLVKPGEKVKRQVSLFSRSDQEFQITGFETKELPIKVFLNDKVKAKKHEIGLELLVPDKPGVVKGYIDIKVISTREQTVQLPVFALIKK